MFFFVRQVVIQLVVCSIRPVRGAIIRYRASCGVDAWDISKEKKKEIIVALITVECIVKKGVQNTWQTVSVKYKGKIVPTVQRVILLLSDDR